MSGLFHLRHPGPRAGIRLVSKPQGSFAPDQVRGDVGVISLDGGDV